MWMRTYGCSSGPSRRPCSPLTTLIKHNWLLWTVWLYYRPNDTESVCVCFTSASLLSNERRHKYCTICASVFIRCVCVGWKLCHPWVFAPLPPPKGPVPLQLSTCNPACVFTVQCFWSGMSDLQRVCAGSSFDLEPGTCSMNTFWPEWLAAKLITCHTCELVCTSVCIFPWYLVCGMKKSVIIAEWKGKRERRWGEGGKEKEKVKLNKFSFSAFNLLKHKARENWE